ncbi:MAG: leucine-rich repeat protein [Lachnospiraceae bacterium]|nr:leucine-rich repeat protein [Lachnospiraceae bacterium]
MQLFSNSGQQEGTPEDSPEEIVDPEVQKEAVVPEQTIVEEDGDEASVSGIVYSLNKDRMTASVKTGDFDVLGSTVSIPSHITTKAGNTYAVTSIDARAFYGASSIQKAEIAEGVETIGDAAFAKSSLTGTIVIPDSVRTIGNDAFTLCSFDRIVIGSGVETLGYAFRQNQTDYVLEMHCTALSSGSAYAFQITNGKLTQAILYGDDPEALLDTFRYLNEADQILTPDAGEGAVSQSALTYTFRDDGTALVTGGVASLIGDTIEIPATVEKRGMTYRVTEIADSAFRDDDGTKFPGVRTLILPEGLEKIGQTAFYNLPLTGQLVIPDSVRMIGQWAFARCPFTSIVLGNGLDTPNAIGPLAFAYGSYEQILVKENVYRLPEQCFMKNAAVVSSVVFEGNDTEVVVYSFGSTQVNDVIFKKTPTADTLSSAFYYLGNVSAAKDSYLVNAAGRSQRFVLEESGEVLSVRDGNIYVISDNKARLVALNGIYSNTIEVPASILVNGQTIPVTQIGEAIADHPYTDISSSYVSLALLVAPDDKLEKVAANAFDHLDIVSVTCNFAHEAIYQAAKGAFPSADFVNNGSERAEIEENGVIYRLSENTAHVIALDALPDNVIRIPATITVGEKEYRVVSIEDHLMAHPSTTFEGTEVRLVIDPDAQIEAVSFSAFKDLDVTERTHSVLNLELLSKLMYMLPDAAYINNAPGVTVAVDEGNTYLITDGAATLVAIGFADDTLHIPAAVEGAPVTAVDARIAHHPLATAKGAALRILDIDPEAPLTDVDLTAFRKRTQRDESSLTEEEKRAEVLPVTDVYVNFANARLKARLQEILPDATFHDNGDAQDILDADALQALVDKGGVVEITGHYVIDHTVTIPAGTEVTFVTADSNTVQPMMAAAGTAQAASAVAGPSLIEAAEDLTGPVFVVEGTLSIADDALTLQAKNTVLLDVKGTLHLSGGTLLGGEQRENASGAVKVGGAFTMTGGEITGTVITRGIEKAPVYVGKGATFTMNGGRIHDNDASAMDNQHGAGAVFVDDGTLVMTGGEISANRGGYQAGGIMVCGSNASFTFSGGSVSNNSAENGGGITILKMAAFRMSGGVVSGNRTTDGLAGSTGYGGGLFLHTDNGRITGGLIENNHAHVAGGGIYVANSECNVYLSDVLITGNRAVGGSTLDAQGAGGGLWFCPTGNGSVHAKSGAAIFDNYAQLAGADVASFSAHPTRLDSTILGSGSVTYYEDGKVAGGREDRGMFGSSFGTVTDPDARYNGASFGTPLPMNQPVGYAFAAKAVVSSVDKAKAQAVAAVVIRGNEAARGGGIGTNGTVVFGEAVDATLEARKTLNNIAPGAERFTFVLEDEYHQEIATAQNDENGVIVFRPKDPKYLHFADEGEKTFYVREINDGQYKIVYDETVYRVEITAEKKEGVLSVTTTYTAISGGTETAAEQMIFRNTREDPDVTPARVRFTAVKYLNNATPNRTFSFTLSDGNGSALQIKSNEGRVITFDEMVFDKEGVYTYVLRETAGSEPYVTYDATTYTATVRVTEEKDERGDITCRAAVTWTRNGAGYTGAEPVFRNTYNPPRTPPQTPPGTPPTPPQTPPQTPPTPQQPAPQVLGARRTDSEAVLGARRGITGEQRSNHAKVLVGAAVFGLINLMLLKKKKDY